MDRPTDGPKKTTFFLHEDAVPISRIWLKGCQIPLYLSLVAGAWTERQKMFHGGSFLKLADDNMDIQNPEAQNRELSGF